MNLQGWLALTPFFIALTALGVVLGVMTYKNWRNPRG